MSTTLPFLYFGQGVSHSAYQSLSLYVCCTTVQTQKQQDAHQAAFQQHLQRYYRTKKATTSNIHHTQPALTWEFDRLCCIYWPGDTLGIWLDWLISHALIEQPPLAYRQHYPLDPILTTPPIAALVGLLCQIDHYLLEMHQQTPLWFCANIIEQKLAYSSWHHASLRQLTIFLRHWQETFASAIANPDPKENSGIKQLTRYFVDLYLTQQQKHISTLRSLD